MMRIAPVVRLLRPHQWLKNLMLLFPPFLGGAMVDASLVGKSFIPLAAFCCASSFTYVLNDLLDAENDARHPRKRNRPIASREVSRKAALLLALLLGVGALILGSRVSLPFLGLVTLYLVINVAYSFRLKEIPLLDIFCISAGFLVRLFAGGDAFSIEISEWLFLSVFLLALFLSVGKRLCERAFLGEGAGTHRRSLKEYPPGFLEGAMYMSGSSVLVTYTMYVINRSGLIWTVPLCCYGLFRYVLRVKSGSGGDPTESLLRDPHLFVVSLLWAVIVSFFLYGS